MVALGQSVLILTKINTQKRSFKKKYAKVMFLKMQCCIEADLMKCGSSALHILH